jgi:hypothetical protein
MLYPIRKPTGPNDYGRAIWELCDRVQALRIMQSGTVQIHQGVDGVCLDAALPSIGASTSVVPYLVKTIYRDHLGCVKVQLEKGSTYGTVTELTTDEEVVAKPFEFQYWLHIQTPGPYNWTPVYGEVIPTNQRDWKCVNRKVEVQLDTALVGETAEYGTLRTAFFHQEIWPPYVEGKTIIAVANSEKPCLVLPEETFATTPDPTTEPALESSLIDLNVTGRCWQDSHRELRICDTETGTLQYIMVRSSQNYPRP